MSSLRRDLIERRLWPIAVVLIAAIVAVPFLLAGHGHTAPGALADASAPVPASAAGTSLVSTKTGSSASPKKSQARRVGDATTRDPFAGGPSTSAGTTSTTTSGAASGGSSSTSTPAAASQATSSSAATPATSASSGTAPSSSTPTDATASSSAPTDTTSTPTTSTTAPTTVVSKTHRATATGRWIVYGVNLRVNAPSGERTVTDTVRFTPLPAASSPRVMFMGATTDGHDAVFALGAGVSARGAGRCRPSHHACTLVSLPVGRTEHFSWPYRADQQRTMELTVTRVSKRVITERPAAKTAIERHSAIGLCELEIGDPIQYQYQPSGELQTVADPTPACTKSMEKIVQAFPGTTEEFGEVGLRGTASGGGAVLLPGVISEDGR